MAHVHAEVVAEMVSQVGESSGRALEVCARHLHALQREKTDSVTVRGCVSGRAVSLQRQRAATKKQAASRCDIFLQLATKGQI